MELKLERFPWEQTLLGEGLDTVQVISRVSSRDVYLGNYSIKWVSKIQSQQQCVKHTVAHTLAHAYRINTTLANHATRWCTLR